MIYAIYKDWYIASFKLRHTTKDGKIANPVACGYGRTATEALQNAFKDAEIIKTL